MCGLNLLAIIIFFILWHYLEDGILAFFIAISLWIFATAIHCFYKTR